TAFFHSSKNGIIHYYFLATAKVFGLLTNSLWLEMHFNCGSAASQEAEPLKGIPSLRMGTRQSLKASSRLPFTLSLHQCHVPPTSKPVASSCILGLILFLDNNPLSRIGKTNIGLRGCV
ncbi:hypothetical protein, partial [Nostoc sp. NMS4]|uniref:hypothetical protein n=1 Tax=Nostoc sp. NMS4 TaxID=2815390 RepID=UPI0025EA0BA7